MGASFRGQHGCTRVEEGAGYLAGRTDYPAGDVHDALLGAWREPSG